MKKRIIWVFAALLLAAWFASPFSVQAAGLHKVIVGGNFTLQSGEVLDEDLTILGGNVTLEEGARLNGNIILLGGRLEVNGKVYGDVLAAGGSLILGSTALISGDVSVAGAVLDRDPKAVIQGDLITENRVPFADTRLEGLWAPFRWWLDSLWNAVWFLGLAFALAALAVLVMMFFERQTENTTRTLLGQPAASAGMGCLTLAVLPLASLLLILTVCFSPVAIVALLLAGVAITFGWIALGYEAGKRLAALLNREWAPPFAAGIGTFFLVLVAGLLNLIPCIGWVYTGAISAAGIGAVLLTGFGMRDYVSTTGGLKGGAPLPPAVGSGDSAPAQAVESTQENP